MSETDNPDVFIEKLQIINERLQAENELLREKVMYLKMHPINWQDIFYSIYNFVRQPTFMWGYVIGVAIMWLGLLLGRI